MPKAKAQVLWLPSLRLGEPIFEEVKIALFEETADGCASHSDASSWRLSASHNLQRKAQSGQGQSIRQALEVSTNTEQGRVCSFRTLSSSHHRSISPPLPFAFGLRERSTHTSISVLILYVQLCVISV